MTYTITLIHTHKEFHRVLIKYLWSIKCKHTDQVSFFVIFVIFPAFVVVCCLCYFHWPVLIMVIWWIYDWIELSIAANGYIQHFNSFFLSMLLFATSAVYLFVDENVLLFFSVEMEICAGKMCVPFGIDLRVYIVYIICILYYCVSYFK